MGVTSACSTWIWSLDCMKQLGTRGRKWKHFVNLAGSELPLMPIEKVEDVIQGLPSHVSVISSHTFPTNLLDRFQFLHRPRCQYDYRNLSVWELVKMLQPSSLRRSKHGFVSVRTEELMEKPPFSLTIFKGLKSVVLSRSFVNFLIFHPLAKVFYEWARYASMPDELFYATLARVQVTSSSAHPDGETLDTEADVNRWFNVSQDVSEDFNTTYGVCTRRILWDDYGLCKGLVKRDVCNLSLHELYRVVNRKIPLSEAHGGDGQCLFTNKFDLSVDPTAVVCLAQHLKIQFPS